MTYQIRTMTANDIKDVLKIEQESYTNPWTEKMLTEELGHSYNYNSVIICNHICGYCLSSVIAEECEIKKITISKSFRRNKLASVLLNDTIKRVKLLNCKNIFLEVSHLNEAAINLYMQFKFTQTGIRKNYYSQTCEDAILMNMRLD